MVVRCHALVPELLDREFLLSLAASKDEKAMRASLTQTPYGPYVEPLPQDARAMDYERAFYELFFHRLERIIRVASDEMAPFLKAYFPLRYEVMNLKRVLRGKYTDASEEEIRSLLLPLPPQFIESYDPLIEAKGVEEAVMALEGTIYKPLIDQLEAFRELEAFWILELALSKVCFDAACDAIEEAPKRVSGFLRGFISLDRSVENILLLESIRMALHGRQIPAEYVEGLIGYTPLCPRRIGDELLRGRSLGEIVDSLKPPLPGILLPAVEGDYALVRTNLKRHLLEMAEDESRKRRFDVSYVLWFLLRCEAEVLDLTRIAWGLDQGLRPERFRRYLILTPGS